MKNLIISSSIRYIQKYNNFSDTKIKEIKYGLESIYLSISKIIVVFILAYLLGMFKEVLIYLIIYNIIRTPSFGLHATKSWICLLSSSLLFIGIPYICLYINISIIVKIIVSIIGIILMFKNSPADTYKRPIVNKKRRERYKFISVILTIIYAFICVLIKNNFISNCFLFSMVMQNFMISPIVYKIFKLPYNNYINFLKEHPDFIQ